MRRGRRICFGVLPGRAVAGKGIGEASVKPRAVIDSLPLASLGRE